MAAVSRRTFLGGAGSLALAAAEHGKAAEPSDRITVGMIAVGSRAQELLEAIKRNEGTEIVAVADAYSGRLGRAVERTGGRAKPLKDYREILADPSVDVVTVASPDHWHKRHVIEALEAGKDVYCEKPLTYTIDEGLEIAAAVKRTGRIVQVGSQGISSAAEQEARKMVASGKLGEVTMVRASYSRNSASGAWLYPFPPDASEETVDWQAFLGDAKQRPFSLERFFRWRCFQEYSGGIATDLFVHLATTIHYVMGANAPSEVVALGDLYRWKASRDVPDTLNALLRYPEGFTVNLSSTFNNRSAGTQFQFMGTEGTLTLGYRGWKFEPEIIRENNDWIVSAWPAKLEEQYRDELAAQPPAPKPARAEQGMPGRGGPDSTTLHFGNFMEAVRTRKQPIEDVWAGHRAAACAHLINASARTGRMTKWDAQRDRQLL